MKHSRMVCFLLIGVVSVALTTPAPVAAESLIDWQAGDACDDWEGGCDAEGRAVLPAATLSGPPFNLTLYGSNTYYLPFSECENCTLDIELEVVSGECSLPDYVEIQTAEVLYPDQLPWSGYLIFDNWDIPIRNNCVGSELAITRLTIDTIEESGISVAFDFNAVFNVADDVVNGFSAVIYLIGGFALGFLVINMLLRFLQRRS